MVMLKYDTTELFFFLFFIFLFKLFEVLPGSSGLMSVCLDMLLTQPQEAMLRLRNTARSFTVEAHLVLLWVDRLLTPPCSKKEH